MEGSGFLYTQRSRCQGGPLLCGCGTLTNFEFVYAVVTSSPLSYLSDSSYYIPGNSVETPGSSIAHQYISGSVRFDDDDLANRYIAVHGNLNLDTEEKKSTHEVQDSPGADGDEVLSADSSLEDQERYGLFFIGEEESFAGSEEHSEQVPFSKFYVPPRGDYRESENRGAVLQTLPEVHPSSVYFDSPVSISETAPAYQTPSRPSSRYGSPKVSTSAPAYAAPSTERTYRPPTTEASPSTTERTYQQVTTERSYRAPTTERAPRPTTPTPVYTPPTPERSYKPPTTTQEPQQVVVTKRRYRTSTTTERTYRPPATEKTYRLVKPSFKTEEIQSTPTKSYTPIRIRNTATSTLKPYTPRRSSTSRTSARITTTTEKPYSLSAPTYEESTERSYGKPKLVSVRKYTGAPPVTSTTEKVVTKKRISQEPKGSVRPRNKYSSPSTTSEANPVYLAPATTEKISHSVYFKPASQLQQEDGTFGSKLTEPNRNEERNSYALSRQPTIVPTYSPPQNFTVKSVSVSSSSSSSQPRKQGSLSRSSSTYKVPSAKSVPNAKKLSSVTPSRPDSRAGSKYEPPVYRTSNKAYQAPSTPYQDLGPSQAVAAAASQPNFVRAGNNIYIPEEYDESSIPGVAGVDYPVHHQVPETGFQCQAQQHPGLYADTDARCQVFHICQESGQHDSFLCPNGTVFNQQYFVCDWWYNFLCDSAEQYFGLNEFIYELPEENYRKS
ncbi:proteoglycan 4-like [Hyalella azteca]|uniref:Proteoglycan 4-like n=1 Tax=Hyalella azteca TaxID=294128 RepID=A0A8B7N898_HYAAZ|nr:proteoglycan 4-like [Hyalella azteca]